MRPLALIAALLLFVAPLGAQDDTLHVLRYMPADTATSANIITVTFDRPVAGQLDATVPAARLLRITPVIAGRTEWRDPVTIRFLPDAPLAPGSQYTVTVSDSVRAIDGTRLARPFVFSFRVPGPRLLATSFTSPYEQGVTTLPYGGKLKILYSAPIDDAWLRRSARLELSDCGSTRSVGFRIVAQRAPATGDPWVFTRPGGWERDRAGDAFRRVVELEPQSALPEGCEGFVVLPTTADDAVNGREERYAIRTALPFELAPFDCSSTASCETSAFVLRFTAPVKQAEFRKYVHIQPEVPLTMQSGVSEWTTAYVRTKLAPRTTYTIVIDTALHAVDGRRIAGSGRVELVTGDYPASLGFATGAVTIPRSGPATVPMRFVNVRRVRVVSYVIPDAQRARLLMIEPGDLSAQLPAIAGRADTAVITLDASPNVEGRVEIPLPSSAAKNRDRLVAMRVEAESLVVAPAPNRGAQVDPRILRENAIRNIDRRPIVSMFALVQSSDLAVHAKAGSNNGVVLVTGLTDARPRAAARVRVLGRDGKRFSEATADSAGVATLAFPRGEGPDQEDARPLAQRRVPGAAVVEAVAGRDRVMLLVRDPESAYWSDDPLDPSELGGRREGPPAMTAALFTERGIYRPGEMVYIKGVLREGDLGALTAPRRRQARLTVTYQPFELDREDDVVIRDTTLRTSEFGTVTDSLRLRAGLAPGNYVIELSVGRAADREVIASDTFRVAEYRAPEFLVETIADSTTRYGGESANVDVSARYLFGAPMGRAAVQWSATLRQLMPWEISIPHAEGWTVGEWTWIDRAERDEPTRAFGAGTLDDAGHSVVRVPIDSLKPSRPGRLTVDVAVTDINRQVVSSTASIAVSPARVYVLARKRDREWFWSVGKPAALELRTVRPDGDEVAGIPIVINVVRRQVESIGASFGVQDSTVRIDTVRSGKTPVAYTFTPPSGGMYEVRLTAADGNDGVARTTFSGYALDGAGWTRASDGYRLPLVASKREASVGDDVDVAFDSPFDEAEAWLTVERETVIERRRVTVKRGPNLASVRIRDGHVPNVFISVLLLPHRRAATERPDSAADLVRLGYTEVLVSAAPKRLQLTLSPSARVYGPGDTAVVRVNVVDASRRGTRSEVTLWAVDEGVLALTGYTTPDLVARLYVPRGLGSMLWSTLPAIVTTVRDEGLNQQYMLRASAASARLEAAVITDATAAGDAPSMRKQFRATAFYLASARTDDSGRVTLRGRVPDNLTTYRVMAVAVGTRDLFGSGDTSMIVTRPLVARSSLPRFVRPADTLLAGAVINARDGQPHRVTVDASAEGLSITGQPHRSLTLAAGTGSEARFALDVPGRETVGDNVALRVRVSGDANGDAVETRIPVKPDFHPRSHAVIGALRGRAEVAVPLPTDTDPARSTWTIRFGYSPIVPMLAGYSALRAYPYDCTEQITSGGRAVLALWSALGDSTRRTLGADPRARLQELVDALARRQRSDGGIRYWDDSDWTSPWLTAYAGLFLLDARDRGIIVDSSVIRRVAGYLKTDTAAIDTSGTNRVERRAHRLALGDRVAAIDFLRRSAAPDVASENRLLAVAARMTWEDRLRLAEVLSTRSDARDAARRLVDEAWSAASLAGRRVDIPDSASSVRAFPSRIAPAARLLTASLALHPDHPMLGGLIETVLQQGRAQGGWVWNTQDYASAVMAMSALYARTAGSTQQLIVRAGGQVVLRKEVANTDSTAPAPLTGRLVRLPNGRPGLPLTLETAALAPMFYAVTVIEVPSKAPVTPDVQGIAVERWYERFDSGAPVTSVAEGDLVRVRLRVTIPTSRQFVALEDPLPAGLEPVDFSLNTSRNVQPFTMPVSRPVRSRYDEERDEGWHTWGYGRWEGGWWSPWEHKALRDDRITWFARQLWPGSYSLSYVARATTSGTFTRPPAHAEEMYNPALQGRSDGGRFGVKEAIR